MTKATNIIVVDYGGANLASVANAFERLDVAIHFSADPETIAAASHVVLPGVGAAGDAMENLHRLELLDALRGLTQPVLGFCLGMQILFDRSEEGNVDMLGLIPGPIQHFPVDHMPAMTVPHMGWNDIEIKTPHPLLKGVNSGDYFYFVHSYFAAVTDATLATCDYGVAFSAVVARDNFMGCQFHPEKSGPVGATIFENFVTL